MKFNKIDYSSFPLIHGRIQIKNNGHICIGKEVKINSGKNFNTIGGDIRMNIIISKNAKLSIGNNVGISNSTIVCDNCIKIEDDVLIGGSCKIYDTDFHAIDYKDRNDAFIKSEKDLNAKTAPVLIKKGAWIGGHSIILKGVTIGEKSIVGAGSVVTKDIPDGEIWAGNPVRCIKKTHNI